MRLGGRIFDGPDTMFRTQQDLVKRAGHSVWLTEFTPARIDLLDFVNRLLHTFGELDMCCALVNAYPAYIAGALSVYSTGGNAVSLLYVARTASPILDSIYNKVPSFQNGPFTFSLTALEQFANYRDFSLFAITQRAETVRLLIGGVDSVTFGAKSSINLLEFLWDTTLQFAFEMYGIVCLPFDSPKVLYIRHYGATSGGWTHTSLCLRCYKDFRPSTKSFLPTCKGSSSCRCHVCLRQPLALRSLASYTVFHVTYNLSEFTLSSRTLYQHYVRAVKSNIVPVGRLIPRSFPTLSCTFVRAMDCSFSKRFHKACITPSQVHWSTHTEETCGSKDETIARFIWIAMNGGVKCYNPLFVTKDCLFC